MGSKQLAPEEEKVEQAIESGVSYEELFATHMATVTELKRVSDEHEATLAEMSAMAITIESLKQHVYGLNMEMVDLRSVTIVMEQQKNQVKPQHSH